MKYSLIISFTLLSLSTAACLPTDHDSSRNACTSNHASSSISHVTHTKPQHRSHSRHTHHNKHNNPKPSTPNTTDTTSTSALVPANLVPPFGIQPGIDPDHGNCKGLNNILIPCICPPDKDAFVAKMIEFVKTGNAEGTPVKFPLDSSLKSQITRLSTSIVTLQNFHGSPGRGCPASSTTFVAQRAALLAKL